MKLAMLWLLVLAGCSFPMPRSDAEGEADGGNNADTGADAPHTLKPTIDFLPAHEVRFTEIDWLLSESIVLDTALLSSSDVLPSGVSFTEGAQRDGSSVAVLRVNHLTISEEKTLRVVGSRPFFVVAKEVTIDGALDAGAKGNAPGPGGGAGPGGLGAGQSTQEDNNGAIRGHSGAGGGSFGTPGGNGGTAGTATSRGGATYELAEKFVGGAAGGRSGSCSNSSGAGGGAVLIYAETSIRIAGSINVGGGGGAEGMRAACDTGTAVRAGGGGGSGGTIWLQTPTLSGSGMLAANGGGGGASATGAAADGVAGEDGMPLLTAARGGVRATSTGDASNGGNGAAQTAATGGASIGASGNTGGGGGGAGRIVYRVPAGLGTVQASPAATRAP